MSPRRIILEMGSGNDLYGGDYTKAAQRAVDDALHHSSLVLFRSLGIPPEAMEIDVHVGVQRPDQIDVETVAARLPYGDVTVRPSLGGMDISDADNDTLSVIATVGIAVYLDLPEERFRLDHQSR